MKVVLDTNIWISSLLLPQSIPGQIYTAWRQGLFTVVTSAPILDEIRKVLFYPKIKKRLLLSPEEIDEYLTLIHLFTESIEILKELTNPIENLRDIKDFPILATLIQSQANYLVTGDQDLLVLNKDFPIITAAQFIEYALG